MAWIAVNQSGTEYVFAYRPVRVDPKHLVELEMQYWEYGGNEVEVPKGTAEKLTGKPMDWSDEPRELK